MKKVEIYTRPGCGFCVAALRLLKSKDVALEEIKVWDNPERKPEMVQRSNGGQTFPQIFVEDIHLGGCDDLMALERSGKLDPMLAA